jgi:hypothetical protein
MIERIVHGSPRLEARITCVFYVLIFVAAPSDAASPPIKMLITLICDTAVALML